MILTELIAAQYTGNYIIIKRLSSDISHAESLLPLPNGGNCLNWLAGHLAVARMNVLAILDTKSDVWNFAQAKRYLPGSAAVRADDSDISSFEIILNALEGTQEALINRLQELDGQALMTIPANEQYPISRLLLNYAQHEAFHIGQIEVWRSVASKPALTGFEL